MSPDDDRIAALERQVAALAGEVARLRAQVSAGPVRAPAAPHRDTFARASAVASSIREEEIESLVGRYGTVLLGAFVLLLGVGVLIQFAVAQGLLTPAVRVGIGALVAAGVGAAGVYFHRRGDVRYANVLLALALALTDLVAWGAGPRLQLVSTLSTFVVVVLVAVALGVLALHDASEFLFIVAVGGALSAPFVTSVGVTTPNILLGYGTIVLAGSLGAMRDSRWERAFALLVGGALAYALAALGMPAGTAGSSPFAVAIFGGACALGALLLAREEWRGGLARAFVAVALVGVPAAWDHVPAAPAALAWAVALGLAAITYAALFVRGRTALWTASALLLPLASLGIAAARTPTRTAQGVVFAIWALFALAAWLVERRRDEWRRSGGHLTTGALLGSVAIAWLVWPSPLALVAALGGWGVLMAWASRSEERTLPILGAAVPLIGSAVSAIDQLASLPDYTYVPFTTRSSLSALIAAVAIAIAGLVLSAGEGAPTRLAGRAVRIGAVVSFVILWGRMEIAGGWNPDLAGFLLIAYYAACGVASIVAGRRFSVSRLRLSGLGLAIFAAVKAIVEASLIGGLPLRVGAYGAVGVFLLAAGYIYRERG
jgi:uncharacterized membrane protein